MTDPEFYIDDEPLENIEAAFAAGSKAATARPSSPAPAAVACEGVTQTILYDAALNAQGVFGNCMQAAVATFFGLPLDAVPHFVAFVDWEGALRLWLRGIGWTVTFTQTSTWPQTRALVTGPSPRGVSHVVVGEKGRLAWDPHPSRDGVTEVRWVWWFERLVPAVEVPR